MLFSLTFTKTSIDIEIDTLPYKNKTIGMSFFLEQTSPLIEGFSLDIVEY